MMNRRTFFFCGCNRLFCLFPVFFLFSLNNNDNNHNDDDGDDVLFLGRFFVLLTILTPFLFPVPFLGH